MRSLLFLACVVPLTAAAPDFVHDIQPIFQKRCYSCHGPQLQLKGLRFDDRQAALRAIQPGESGHSRLIEMVTGAGGKFMPPVGNRLTNDEVAMLRAWIDQAAQVAGRGGEAPACGLYNRSSGPRPAPRSTLLFWRVSKRKGPSLRRLPIAPR